MENLDRLRLDKGKPLAGQIVFAIVETIRSGDTAVGTRLPSIRALADRLGMNRNTVAQAYKELAEKGYLSAVPFQRIGTTGLVDTRLFAHVHDEVGELRFHCREGALRVPLPLRKFAGSSEGKDHEQSDDRESERAGARRGHHRKR